ncbi:hypothetical protein BKH41_03790 [Helicobacter sp. 12S02232-10]|uniref:phage holin family protein n=1 Tax=Helicobacter sp. 12S02232-10 TaxID=1476197 RepID=UPI000BA5754E|nr:phage holin family protein [Helicobacter sp. 12S02232-10]PAF49212.1 hypothetical protein BKH41_03790 [Helicobacter sp. 12S02232-10]
MSFWENMKFYIFLATIGALVGVLYVLRTIQEEHIDTKSKALQFIIYGVGSSMLVTWIGYEIAHTYYGLPDSLSCAIGGGLGFIGAETISRLLIKLFKKKTGIGDEK